jgi:choline dehydrogenase-like flavoprotein
LPPWSSAARSATPRRFDPSPNVKPCRETSKVPSSSAFIRDAASTYWHQTGTAKMGHDAMSVVDGSLKVYGVEHLRIADGSIMPRVTTGNTMAPCVIIGERAAEILHPSRAHALTSHKKG